MDQRSWRGQVTVFGRGSAWRLFAALLVVAVLGGWWLPKPALAGAATTGSLVAGGRERTFRVYVPASYDGATPVPLVLVFHGAFGSGDQVARQTGFDEVAEREGFIVVYPDGTSLGRAAVPTWNAGHCCGGAMIEGVDDVAFVATLLDQPETDCAIDAARIYVLGCRLADRLTAIAPVSGTAFAAGCAPARPLSVLQIHGTADQFVPYAGGIVENAVPPRSDPAVADVIAFW